MEERNTQKYEKLELKLKEVHLLITLNKNNDVKINLLTSLTSPITTHF